MRKYVTYALTAFILTISVAIAASDKEKIIEKEKAAWQAFKDKKSDDFKKLMSPDMVAIYSHGIFTLQKEVDSMSKMEMKSFTFGECNVAFPDADTATITCKVTIEAKVEGQDISGNYNSGSVWKKQAGEWRGIFHTDMKEEAVSK